MKSMEGTSSKAAVIYVVPPNNKEKKTIVILGVERGGTSMVAGVIRALGIDLGQRAGRNHEDPKFLTDDRSRLLKQIAANNSSKDVWGFKIPKASMMLDFYDRHLVNPHYILVFRNIAAVVDSWCSRGANDPLRTVEHTLNYYGNVVKFLTEKNRPLAFVNYERGCEDKFEFVEKMSHFVGVDADESLLNKAVLVISGEGGGYLDIPEYYFHVSPLTADTALSDEYQFDFDPQTTKYCAIGKKKVSDRLILLPQDRFFPKEFFIQFDLYSPSVDFLDEGGLRLYFDFKDEFFPGHCIRPLIVNGKNVLGVSSNGKVKRIAFGSLRNDSSFSVSDVRIFSSAVNGNKLEVAPANSSWNLYRIKLLKAKAIRRIKQVIGGHGWLKS